MKKLLSLALVLVMALSMLAACGNTNTETPDAGNNDAVVIGPASALEVLENTWALFGDNEKFPVMGGDFENAIADAPGVWNSDLLVDLSYSLQLPEAEMAKVADAATMIHMMNANTFTGAVLHLNEGEDVAAFAATAKDAVMAAQWMCGFPEKLVIADMGGQYLVMAFGLNDAINPFEAKLTEAYADAKILYSEAIAG